MTLLLILVALFVGVGIVQRLASGRSGWRALWNRRDWLAAALLLLLALLIGGLLFAAALLLIGGAALAAVPEARRAYESMSVVPRFGRALEREGLPPVWVRSKQRIRAGWRLEVQFPRGLAGWRDEKHSARLASSLRAHEVRCRHYGDDARRGYVLIRLADPLAALGTQTWPLADADALDLWRPLPLGVDEDGEHVTVTLPHHNLFMAGEPGSGKTAATQLLVAAAALDPDCDLFVLDGKEVDLVDWQPRCRAFAGADVGEALAALNAAQGWMRAAYGRLRAEGKRKVGPGDPVAVVVVDELAFYVGSGRKGQVFTDLLRDLVQRGRAAGMIVVAATQRPGADIVPTSLRDLFAYRLGFRCTTDSSSDMALGHGWAARGYDCSTIPSQQRGVGYLLAEGALPVRMRCCWLADDEVAAIAERACEPGAAGPPEGLPSGCQPSEGRAVATGNGNAREAEPAFPETATTTAASRADLEALISEHLNGEPIRQSDLARRVGRKPTDGSVRRALARLEAEGRAERTAGGWMRGPE